jgi:small subunit ribosomal protein S17
MSSSTPKGSATPANSAAPPDGAQVDLESTAPETVAKPPRHQRKVGRVVSNKMQKTIVVAVESLKRHPVYKKSYKWTKKFKAHDEENTARIGDLVLIEETRPLSKEKRWQLIEIMRRADQAPAVAEVATADLGEAGPVSTTPQKKVGKKR